MKFILSCILSIIIFLGCYFTSLNALDITALSSFVSPKVLKCYKCSSLMNDDCKNLTNALKKDAMAEECMAGAQGCVKQWIKTSHGRTAIFRECYYGSISSFYTNFQCEGTARHRLYDKVLCYKCRGNLCNNSNRVHYTSGILVLYTTLLLITSYILRI